MVVAVVGVVAIVAGVALLVARDDSGGTAVVAAPVVTSTTTTTTLAPTTTVAPTTTTTVDPGTLPQTPDKPSTTSAVFQEHVADLWRGIVTDDVAAAMPFFFPLGAYLQVKSISNPEADWNNRLVNQYRADIHAYHALLGADASVAQFAGFDVPDTAVWVQPGAEYNKGSYWRVYDSQLRYTVNGQARSFVVKSMISWRGEWYVVHLVAIQ